MVHSNRVIPQKPDRSLYAVLVMISAIGPVSLNIFQPSIPGLAAEFNVSAGHVQLTLSIYLCGLAVSQLVYGPLSDRFGRRPLVLAGLTLFVASSAFCAVAQSVESLIVLRGAQAIGGASGMVLSRAIIRDLHNREAAASVIGYVTMVWVLAPMLAPLLGGWLDQVADWRAGFWVLTTIGMITLAIMIFKLPETNLARGKSENRLAAYAALIRMGQFHRYVWTLAFTSTVFFTFLGGAPFLVVDVFQRPPLDYGLWFLFVSVGYMAGNFLSGRYSQRLGIDRMIATGNGLALGGVVIMLMGVIAGFAWPAAIFVPMLLVTLGNGLTIPNGTSGAISVEPHMIGAAAGLAGFMQMVLGAAGAQLSGILQPYYPFASIWIMALAGLFAAVSFYRIGHR